MMVYVALLYNWLALEAAQIWLPISSKNEVSIG